MIFSAMNNGHIAYHLNCYICETTDDVDLLPVDGIAPGSKAFCIETQKKFMYSSVKGWVPVEDFPW